MSWTTSKTQICQSETTPCREIFQTVCDEIGAYYESNGFKYSRSIPKITFKDASIKFEICFNSSGSNMQGNYVNLEINPYFYSTELSKIHKNNGFLFGALALFYQKYTDNPKQVRLRQIFGDVVEQIDEYSNLSEIKDNRNCNLYGLDDFKFNKIIEFIDRKILPWILKIQNIEGINELIENPSGTRIWALNLDGKSNNNSMFVEYVKLKFPSINI